MLPACYVDGLKSAGEYFLPFEEVHLKKAKDLGRLCGRLSFPGCLLQIRLFSLSEHLHTHLLLRFFL